MRYILDTGVLLAYIRRSPLYYCIQENFKPFVTGNYSAISIVNRAETLSIGKRKNWGSAKLNSLRLLLDALINYPISSFDQADIYAELDNYSLSLNYGSIKMGKNDLWVAVATVASKSELITTDKHFGHFYPKYFKVHYFNPEADYSAYVPS